MAAAFCHLLMAGVTAATASIPELTALHVISPSVWLAYMVVVDGAKLEMAQALEETDPRWAPR